MKKKPAAWGRLLREERAAPYLYGSYAWIGLCGFGLLGWITWSDNGWRWLLVALGLATPLKLFGGALLLWGVLGAVRLRRHRLRFYELGLYQGPKSGRGGTFLRWTEIRELRFDRLLLPQPWGPIVGHYRVAGAEDEILLYPKLYRDIDPLLAEIARRSHLAWEPIRLSRDAP